MAAAVAATALGACAHRSATPPPLPPLTRIRVLPVTAPDRFYTYNNMVAGFIGASIANRIKSNLFTEKMEAERRALGPKMTAALIDALKNKGYSAEAMPLPAGAATADDIDVAKLPPGDPVLYAQFGEAGMDSARFSSVYLPRLNLGASLTRPGSADELFSTSLYYGADARGEADWSLPAAPRFQFPDFEALMDRTPEVVASFDDGIRRMAERVAQQLKNRG